MRIVECVRTAIDSGSLSIGDKLPTNRELSSFLKVDRSTVARAYLELSRLGLIDSQVGRRPVALQPHAAKVRWRWPRPT
jgi:DNA-binding transcriptional regulator YhcF (GntR family)